MPLKRIATTRSDGKSVGEPASAGGGAEASGTFLDHLNPGSLEVIEDAKLEPALAEAAPGDGFQFERVGYFYADPVDSTPGRPIFNRTATLRDSWKP